MPLASTGSGMARLRAQSLVGDESGFAGGRMLNGHRMFGEPVKPTVWIIGLCCIGSTVQRRHLAVDPFKPRCLCAVSANGSSEKAWPG